MQILSDTTVDTAGTLVDAHTPQVGGAWVKNAASTATAQVSNAQRFRAGGTGFSDYYCTNVPASPDHWIQCDIFIASITTNTSVTGPCVRMDAAAETCYQGGYNANTLKWEISKRVATTKTILASTAATLTVGGTYAVQLVIVGSTLTLFVNGVSTVTATDGTITATGQVGLRFGVNATETTGHHLTNILADDGAPLPRLPQFLRIRR